MKKWGWILCQTGQRPLTIGDATWGMVVYGTFRLSGSVIAGVIVAMACGTFVRFLADRAEKVNPKLKEVRATS
jgi:hypothetical protein